MSPRSLHSLVSWSSLGLVLGALGCTASAGESSEAEVGEATQPLVVGDDDRVRVEDTKDPAYSAVVRIGIEWKDGNGFCSGSLIDDRHVLTAGHCVYNAERGGYAKQLTIVPGATEEREPFGHARTKKMVAHPRWVAGQDAGHSDRGFDLSVVELKEPFDAGHVEMHAASDDELEHEDLVVTGYPADLGGRDMFTATGSLVTGATVMPDVLIHTVDTFGGDSGAGISFEDGRLVGLHVAHKSGLWAHNTGMRLTSEKIDWVNEQRG